MVNSLAATVFIVDDDPSVLRSIGRVVRVAGYEPKGFPSAEDFLEHTKCAIPHPACAIVDLKMPGLGGLALQSQMKAEAIACPIVFLSGNGSIPETVEAMKHGAVSFLQKPFETKELLLAVAEGLERHRNELFNRSRIQSIRERIEQLTGREREVMAWVITGSLNKQIAGHLVISEKTVKVHRARVMEKMKVMSVAELVRLCGEAGFEAGAESIPVTNEN